MPDNDLVDVSNINSNLLVLQSFKPSMFLRTAINVLLGFGGVAAFIFLLMGGIQWITAGGDKDAVDKARKKILGALIGLAIVLSSYAILYIMRALFNINLISINISQIGS